MTSPNIIPADAVLVAIDIAKLRNEVLIEAPGHKRGRWRFRASGMRWKSPM
ncbi:hypothetical protein GTK01_14565 [Aliihoeflea sp. 40Bstr573]|nr:hypothetical protein [Aliihoeflea sp. 40Bstr573]